MDKARQVAGLERNLKHFIAKSIRKENYEKALAGINACAQLLYLWNQKYIDEELEQYIEEISKKVVQINLGQDTDRNTVLFYDGFGLDTRGLALIYLKAIAQLGYKIIYLVPQKSKGGQSDIHRILDGCNVEWIYYSENSYLNRIKTITSTFDTFKPSVAFFYSMPDDVAAAVAFFAYAGLVTRFQINLTDHAYWLGTNIFDFCIEFRDYGASISYYYRGIPREKLIKLPYYPYYDKEKNFEGFPFESKNKKIIFSGGALYKTLGDSENTYYKVLDQLLTSNSDVIFLYAGSGDSTELDKMATKFSQRVYHVNERKDLYQVMQRCTFYLNTYPMLGGLMTQYAVAAGKVPLTMVRKGDVAEGILIEQEKREIEYFDSDSLIQDANKLLNDEEYLHDRECKLIGSIISEKEFKEELQSIIRKNNTKYTIRLKKYDVNEFAKEYKQRFDYDSVISGCIAKKCNLVLIYVFPKLFIKKIINKIIKKLEEVFIWGKR